ncbi:hypothetical protein K1T71_000830 [Dendrolimus kikuchii]|uniref:Uncharacterized protein n=1 Tax=Dendrolimus kikuchii TaxID=765133 RepID=A0ACC1DLE7_9NEOP|nr:hypothetical protein K1T71_000830 [Dendrolimus kikuchii]
MSCAKEKEVLLIIIDLYRDMPYLWKEHKNYVNKEIRSDGFNVLLQIYKNFDEQATIKTLKRKIENMRTTYAKELKKPETSRSIKRKVTDACEDNIDLDKAMEVLNYTDDSYDTFGKHITAELRKYDPITLAHVKKAIMNILFQADTGMLPGTRQQGYYTQQYGQTSANVQNSQQYG